MSVILVVLACMLLAFLLIVVPYLVFSGLIGLGIMLIEEERGEPPSFVVWVLESLLWPLCLGMVLLMAHNELEERQWARRAKERLAKERREK